MIKVTRLNHVPMILNSDLIEHIDVTPDTVITLTSGQKYVVLESAEEILERVVTFRKSIFGKDLFCPIAAMPKIDRPSSSTPEDAPSNG
jgi:flagellar protein FlbD